MVTKEIGISPVTIADCYDPQSGGAYQLSV